MNYSVKKFSNFVLMLCERILHKLKAGFERKSKSQKIYYVRKSARKGSNSMEEKI